MLKQLTKTKFSPSVKNKGIFGKKLFETINFTESNSNRAHSKKK